jgi:hypothetical protein
MPTYLRNRTDVTPGRRNVANVAYQRSVSREEVDVRIWEADFLFGMEGEGWGRDG